MIAPRATRRGLSAAQRRVDLSWPASPAASNPLLLDLARLRKAISGWPAFHR